MSQSLIVVATSRTPPLMRRATRARRYVTPRHGTRWALMRRAPPLSRQGTTHRIDGDLDAARTLIVDFLRKAGLVTAVVLEPGMGRTTTAVNGGGDRFATDGLVAVVALKNT